MSVFDAVWKLLERIPIAELLINKGTRSHEHDRAKLKQLEEVLSEESLDQFLNAADSMLLRNENIAPIKEYLRWQRREGNQFLIKDLRLASLAFESKLRELKDFTAVHFFVAGSQTETLYAFRPDQNPETGSGDPVDVAFFDKCRQQLSALVFGVEAAYKVFRRTAKRRLQQ